MEGKKLKSNPEKSGNLASSQEFENNYREAYKLIDQGITLVTEGKNVEASRCFENGLKLIDAALSVKIETYDVSAEQTQLYAEMQSKMRRTRKEVMAHFADIQVDTQPSSISAEPPSMEEAPPSYDDYLHSLQTDASGEISGAAANYPSLKPQDLKMHKMDLKLQESTTPSVTPIMSPQNGELIFQIENGVQIFFIYPDGRVTSPSYPSFLYIFTFPEPICSNEVTQCPGARGFLQVGEWSYPLVPTQSPVLHSFYGAYMFPDATNPIPGTNVGILIPDTVPKDITELFEQILSQMTSYLEQDVPLGFDQEEERAKMAMSAGERIAEGAEFISKGVVWGADKLSGLISYGSEKLRESMAPEQEHRSVDPKWQKTAQVAKDLSGTAVKFSGFLLSQVGKATNALGCRLAPTIHKQSTKAVSRLTGQSEKVSTAQVSGVMEVASGAVRGFSAIYMSLESAATTLASSLSDNTVKVVTHKYGPEYGMVTGDTLHAVGQTAMAGHNFSGLGVKGVAKRAAKDAGKAVVHDYENKKKMKEDGYEEVMDGIEEGVELKEKEGKQPNES